MLILKKIIIMTEYQNSNVSGIVKFENFAGRTTCFVRILGLRKDGEICIKCGEDIMYCGSLVTGEMKFGALYDLTKPIYIAVADEGKIVCMGSNTGRFSPSVLSGYLYQYYADSQGQRNYAPDKKQESSIETDEIQTEEAREETEEASSDNKDMNEDELRSKKASEQSVEQTEEVKAQSEQTVKEEIKTKKNSAKTRVEEPFYKQIEASMKELFDKYEDNAELNLLVPDSKWVRVPVDGQNYYVVGLIYSDGKPDLICYGVPDKDNANPPQNANECRQWLELEKGGRGYWMMYQSAVSGQTLTTQII